MRQICFLSQAKSLVIAIMALLDIETIIVIKTNLAIMTFLTIKIIIHLFKIESDFKYKEFVLR